MKILEVILKVSKTISFNCFQQVILDLPPLFFLDFKEFACQEFDCFILMILVLVFP